MKKIWFMLVMICSVCAFTACSDNDDNKGDETPVCPVKNAALDKTTAKIGDQLILSGEGFVAGAKLALEKDTHKTAISDWKVATDGKQISFVIPEVEEGSYNLILNQDGEWDLKLTLKIENKTYSLTGMSYEDGEKGEGDFTFKFTYTGRQLTTIQKADAANPGNWLDYMTLDYSEQNAIKVKAFMENVDPYSTKEGWQDFFTIVLNGNQVKNIINKGETIKDWTYTEKGYLKVACSAKFVENGYVYDEQGNLTRWDFMNMGQRPVDFVYENTTYPNNIGFELGAMFALIKNNCVIQPEFYANLLGLTGKVSAYLPSGMKGFKNGESTTFAFNYMTDENKLVKEFSVKLPYNYYNETTQQMVTSEATKKITFTWEEN